MSIGLKVTVFLVGCNGNWKKRNSTCAVIDPPQRSVMVCKVIPADYNVMLRLMSCERNWTCFACLKSILTVNHFGPVISK